MEYDGESRFDFPESGLGNSTDDGSLTDQTATGDEVSLEDLVAAMDQQLEDGFMEAVEPVSFPAPQSASNLQRFVVFSVSGTRYGVAIEQVFEIGEVPPVTSLPNVPAWVRGIANLRGEILAILDFRQFLELQPVEDSRRCRLLVAHEKRGELTAGLIVDEVNGVANLNAKDFGSPPASMQDPVSSYLVGVDRSGEDLLAILDLQRLLKSSEVRRFDH